MRSPTELDEATSVKNPPISITKEITPPETYLKPKIKSWIKKIPFFAALDYYRRKVYESPLFDFLVDPLARKLEDWPQVLLIDNTNSCNAKCVWCPNPDLTNLGVMKMDLYKKIIDDYATRGGRVRFGTFGEPLLDKTFGEKIRYLRRHTCITGIEVLTNAYFLNQKIIPVLVENSVAVEISLDELDKKTFEDVKKMSYDVVRTNIIDYLKANESSACPVPVNIRIKTLKTREETINHEFFKTLQGHDCTLELTPINQNIITDWAGKFDKDAFFKEYKKGTGPARYSDKKYNISNQAPCVQLWKWLVVYWDGQVVLCCVDMFSTTHMGNLKDQSIKEIWQGPALKKLRNKMRARGRFDIPICKNCDIHLGWNNLKVYYTNDGKLLPNLKFIS